MPFKKLNIALKDVLEEEEITAPLPFQVMSLPKIKSGADFFFIAPKGSGKTMSIAITVVQRMLSSKSENAPRALIIVKDKKEAQELEEIFKDITLMMDLEVFSVFDSQQIYNQKDTIYYGVDIVIATPQRLFKLYTQSGINLKEIKMFVIKDAELMINNHYLPDIERIGDAINKSQRLVFASEYLPRFDDLKNSFMDLSQVIEFND